MDDILSSIRNILNEDEQLDAAPAPLELTEDMLVPTPKTPAAMPESQAPAPPSAPEPKPAPAPAAPRAEAPRPQPSSPAEESGLVSPLAAAAAAAAIGQLARAVADDRKASVQRGGGVTIEDLVREELRPMLKSWLDQHLPPLVERLVKSEIEKLLSRNAG
ncbi:DUF2497 domain-containing protein [Pseudoroseomonas cervicalis]|uniref:DUF2497 domain-containing protein n=1 Tax=Teichococcus cervicalis TaxID=204525 RepID=UPI0022F1CF5A|nr:DUF2497 domain-containing protein [Pseudoroseomonas cervicalis]WBV41489.1 DUF2497 domain-containing protein [Pseudoroseomonas cervicalis]